MTTHLNRRRFLRQAGAAAAAAGSMARLAPAKSPSPNGKLNIAVIGTGGRGRANMLAMAEENVVALCDVDRQRLDTAGERFPKARKYADFRKLLEQEKDLDAAVVSTPDHTHAPASVMAMNLGLHVYCEKPLTHSVHEARVVTETAARRNVITQMGTQTSTSGNNMRAVELIQAGAIGPVREVHVWAGLPVWPQGDPRPDYQDPVPPHLDWDLWTGPAPMRPYVRVYRQGRFKDKPVYHPFAWRGWWDFGTGKFGDQCCHQCNVVFWALGLEAPTSVKAESSAPVTDGFPDWEIIRFQFPAREGQPPVELVWYDGEKVPPPEIFTEETEARGPLFIGEKGQLLVNPPTLLPARQFADYQRPEPRDWDRVEVHEDWIRGIKTGKQPGCHFGYSGPMAESLLLGNVALRVGQEIRWDPEKLKVTNRPEANQYVKRQYREGWTL